MKSSLAIMFVVMCVPLSANAEETKGFWASLVPDNSSAFTFVETSKSFFGQLFEDGKTTGKDLMDGGKDLIDTTGDTIKSITSTED